jgi:hypothetical protein
MRTEILASLARAGQLAKEFEVECDNLMSSHLENVTDDTGVTISALCAPESSGVHRKGSLRAFAEQVSPTQQ